MDNMMEYVIDGLSRKGEQIWILHFVNLRSSFERNLYFTTLSFIFNKQW